MRRWVTIGLAAGVLLIAACTSGPVASPSPPAVALQATPAPTAAPLPPSAPPATTSNGDSLAKGKVIFEKTAGGVGCASCHGLDGKGGLPGVGAPDIRGASEARVRGALAGGVPLMSFIKLSDEEKTAVVAYLKYLNERS